MVELFNDALTFELTVTNTYFLHARMLDNWGFGRLGKVFYDLSIDEMRDADAIISRILLFDGHPNLQRLGAIQVGEDAEEMLRLALESEKAAVAQFNAGARECHDLGDHGSAAVFEEMVRDEEKHADWFESQLDAIARVGADAVPRPADRRRRPRGLTGPARCRGSPSVLSPASSGSSRRTPGPGGPCGWPGDGGRPRPSRPGARTPGGRTAGSGAPGRRTAP